MKRGHEVDKILSGYTSFGSIFIQFNIEFNNKPTTQE